MPTEPLKPGFSLIALENPHRAGDKLKVSGELAEVTRSLTDDEVNEIAIEFFIAIMAVVPPGADVFWCEYRLLPH
jgi:hypothetical protein